METIKLLEKYIQYVKDCEGTTFIDVASFPYIDKNGIINEQTTFTKKELLILNKINDKIMNG